MIEELYVIVSGGWGKLEREGGVEEDLVLEEDWVL